MGSGLMMELAEDRWKLFEYESLSLGLNKVFCCFIKSNVLLFCNPSKGGQAKSNISTGSGQVKKFWGNPSINSGQAYSATCSELVELSPPDPQGGFDRFKLLFNLYE